MMDTALHEKPIATLLRLGHVIDRKLIFPYKCSSLNFLKMKIHYAALQGIIFLGTLAPTVALKHPDLSSQKHLECHEVERGGAPSASERYLLLAMLHFQGPMVISSSG